MFEEIITNNALIIPICSWALAQVLKAVIMLLQKKQFDVRFLVRSGGMPSSHSAFVTALATSVAIIEGPGSVAFAISAVFTLVVIYDAAGVRRSVGQQSVMLNHIIRDFRERRPAKVWGHDLRVFLGHTPLQVFVGALMGIAIAWVWLGIAATG